MSTSIPAESVSNCRPEYLCSVCDHLLDNPVETECCGNWICSSCALGASCALGGGLKVCPIPTCGCVDFRTHPALKARHLVRQVVIRCPFGCEFFRTYGEYVDEKHVENCGYRVVKCAHCKSEMADVRLAEHVMGCVPVSCPHKLWSGCTVIATAQEHFDSGHKDDFSGHVEMAILYADKMDQILQCARISLDATLERNKQLLERIAALNGKTEKLESQLERVGSRLMGLEANNTPSTNNHSILN